MGVGCTVHVHVCTHCGEWVHSACTCLYTLWGVGAQCMYMSVHTVGVGCTVHVHVCTHCGEWVYSACTCLCVHADIRDSVKYKEVMEQYKLGPNGAIVTSLNLFASRFDQVMGYLEKRPVDQK